MTQMSYDLIDLSVWQDIIFQENDLYFACYLLSNCCIVAVGSEEMWIKIASKIVHWETLH